MRIQDQSGFTIIEVTLFLAITGLLLVIAIAGTGTTIRSIRFTDSVNSLQSYVQQQFDQLLNGVDSRDNSITCAGSQVQTNQLNGDQPGASNCLLLGRMLKFTKGSSQVQSYIVVGTEPAGVDLDQGDQQLVLLYKPTVVRTAQTDSFDIPWGANVSAMVRKDSSNTGVDSFLLLRSPRSSRIMTYEFKDSGANDLTSTIQAANVSGNTTNVCVINADGFGPLAMVVLGTGEGQGAITTQFGVDQATNCQEGA